ncbi:hypothetical protein ACK2SD_23050 [Pseudomonas sp. SC11]|uniref:hypothetical protein n=1 Tax=Pseudomonas sp. SC11 TaxID=326927 RepID=UPI003999FB1C
MTHSIASASKVFERLQMAEGRLLKVVVQALAELVSALPVLASMAAPRKVNTRTCGK